MNKHSSGIVGRFSDMQMRFWGGWFLVIAGLAIMLSMGCEKGALGVKPAMVMGRIVKADNDSVGIADATVRIMSKEALGTSELKMGKNFLTTTTDANGYFSFENVVPDNILVEFSKGSNKGTYPTATTSTTDEETGDTSESAQLEAVYVKSGAVVNLGSLPLTQSQGTLPSNVNLKLDLVNKTTLERITDPSLKFVVTVNGVPLADTSSNTSLTADQLRAGVARASEQTFSIVVRHDSDTILYQTTAPMSVTVSGEEIYERIELTPVSYNLLLRCVNVPDYITISAAHVNIYAENNPVGSSKPPQVLATHTIANPGAAGALPALITIPALSMPVDLRIQVRGYQDEVLKVDVANLPEGTQGSYRIDLDFLNDNGVLTSTYHPTTNNVAGIFDNMLRRNLVLAVAGEHLLPGNFVSGVITLPHLTTSFAGTTDVVGNLVWTPGAAGVAPNAYAYLLFEGTAVGYNLGYNVTVSGGASGSFNLYNTKDIIINPEIEPTSTTLVVGVNADRTNKDN